ncbi:MAG: HAD-IA family hydrolase [Steroidobacteraceae bacterium]|jgi:putative hydrolase of the HAD superfamily|nr:HAD-IA family hydrolase [Steroidobacteraceae bacterium]
MLDGLQALCFDLDDTFWDVRRVLERAEQRVAGFLAAHYPRLARHSRAELMAARMALAREVPVRAHDLTWLRTETLRRLAVDAGYPGAVGEQAFEVFIAARNEVDLFPDVRPALDRLAAHYTLATFSNGNADLGRIGLAPLFAVTLNAERVGVAKPHPGAFAAVARELGCEPGRMLYVGDDPQADVAGARAAGLRTAWINRHGAAWPDAHAPADLEIVDLHQLEAELGAARARRA